MDPSVLLVDLLGHPGRRGTASTWRPFISALHIAFGVGVVASLLGAVVSASRGGQQVDEDDAAVGSQVAA